MESFCSIPTAIRNLALAIREKSNDGETLDVLVELSEDRGRWHEAHRLFSRIRAKNLQAQQAKQYALAAQYSFEEICAKTFYNLGRNPAPFDPDSPYWIIPRALNAGSYLEIAEEHLWQAIRTQPPHP